MERRLLLDVVIRKRAAVLELLAGEDEALLIRGDALLVLDLDLQVVDRVARLGIESDRLAGQRLHEDLHAAAEPQHEVQRRLLLDLQTLGNQHLGVGSIRNALSNSFLQDNKIILDLGRPPSSEHLATAPSRSCPSGTL